MYFWTHLCWFCMDSIQNGITSSMCYTDEVAVMNMWARTTFKPSYHLTQSQNNSVFIPGHRCPSLSLWLAAGPPSLLMSRHPLHSSQAHRGEHYVCTTTSWGLLQWWNKYSDPSLKVPLHSKLCRIMWEVSLSSPGSSCRIYDIATGFSPNQDPIRNSVMWKCEVSRLQTLRMAFSGEHLLNNI